MTKAKLTLIRGLPGSGKSTLAQKLARQEQAVHIETDMFFVDANGEYHFDPQRLSEAHQWCLARTIEFLQNQQHVIVSNTFVRHWELAPYRRYAQKNRIPLNILVCNGNYASIHQVSVQTIEKMRKNWQD
ncbi:hypothetical protein ATY35_13005 [Vibrio cidicii]|uniref:AAA family ATPase n=1 Tax=Vibrio cidicii TaxID=1763883 RepID=A0ABR5W5W4_9VIBR|nr:ATP-binding protein [Vibrio cidicii]KYN86751.1 hypothetical protein ATY35_13005 [Vibrio cidicii]